MKRTLTDFSQLSKALLKTPPRADEVKPQPPKPKADDDGAAVIAYFARPAGGAKPARNAPAPEMVPAQDFAALQTRLREAEAARDAAETQRAAAERERLKAVAARDAALKDVARLEGECGRLRGELRKAARSVPAVAEASPPAPERAPSSPPPRGLLAPPAAFAETFPGELREMVVSALSDARDTARQSSRERRATVLDAVLAVNPPTGELDARREQLKQALKDCGASTDPKSLAKLGFKLVSGRTHWKLEYANVRLPIAKTPSDFRAMKNAATDMANRCF